MNFEEIIRKRQATRDFSDKKVEKEKLDKILEAGRLAPTAKNLQPVKIFVIESDDAINRLDKATPCRYNAKTVLLVCASIDEAFKKDDHSTYEMDASIITTHMMLEATNLGVDNIWVEMFDKKIIMEEYKLPNNLIPICLLPLGYRSSNCPESHSHNIRKEIDELVEYI